MLSTSHNTAPHKEAHRQDWAGSSSTAILATRKRQLKRTGRSRTRSLHLLKCVMDPVKRLFRRLSACDSILVDGTLRHKIRCYIS